MDPRYPSKSSTSLVIRDFRIRGPQDLRGVVQKLRDEAEEKDVELQTEEIVSQVRRDGEKGLLKLTNRFDGADFSKESDLFVSREEIRNAHANLAMEDLTAIKQELRQIRAFSHFQLERFQEKRFKSPLGFTIVEGYVPLDRIGGYVPGGLANYPSTVLMISVPAKAAGVKEIILATPPKKDGSVSDAVLVAADLSGVSQILKVGGAQAVAAMALGTSSIGRVQLIAGPGNDYVTTAKKQLTAAGEVLIDSLAGPTELLILADESAKPQYVAEDLFSQAEHGNRTLCGVVSNSEELIVAVRSILSESRPRPRMAHILRSTLFTVLASNMDQMVQFSQELAPEHLELMIAKSDRIIPRLKSAGLVLVGEYTPCSSTDYIVGTNHILPTGGSAVNFPGLGVEKFLKRVTTVRGTKEALVRSFGYISALTQLEGLPNHSTAVEVRFRKEERRK